MTALQVYENVLIEINKVKAPSLSLSDFLYIFNKATQQYINEVYSGYEINQQKVDDLRVVRGTAKLDLIPATDLSDTGIFEAVYETYLPDDYLHILNCIVRFVLTPTKRRCQRDPSLGPEVVYQGAKRLSSDANPQVIHNFYLKPSYKNPYFYINNVNSSNEFGASSNTTQVVTKAIRYSISNAGLEDPYTLNFTLNGTPQQITLQVPPVRTPNLIYTFRNLLKDKNSNPILEGMKIEMDGENTIYISLINAIFTTDLTGDNGLIIREAGEVDFSLERESYVRYGNRTKARMEIRYGMDNTTAVPTQALVDYLKTPQQVTLTEEQINDVEDNSQHLEFPDYVIYEIINRAVKIILENIGDPRLQTSMAVNTSIPVK